MPVLDLAGLSQAAFDQMAYRVGNGSVVRGQAVRDQPVRLAIGAMTGDSYANAQLDDYHADNTFRWRPPLKLQVTARFSARGDDLTGTAGFGFWNDPLGMTGRMRLRRPQCVWFFFGGGPNYIPLVLGDPGRGWCAATMSTASSSAMALAPLAPLLAGLMRVPRFKRPIWRWLKDKLQLSGYALDPGTMPTTHRYELAWQTDAVRFAVDDQLVGTARAHVKGPLGLVIWIDNQYMVATPEGRLRHGTVATPGQWLEIEQLTIDAG